jgi:hypothetical protein
MLRSVLTRSAQTTLSDLTAQLAILKRPTPGDSNEIKALMIRANNAERRLANAQNQLAAAEEKMAAMNQKTTAADSKWEARVKEYEARLRAAEEKVKRERQGYKERVVELETQIKCVRRCFPLALARGVHMPSNAVLLILVSLFFFCLGHYRDKGKSLISGISSWLSSRPRCRTRWRRQHDSPHNPYFFFFFTSLFLHIFYLHTVVL